MQELQSRISKAQGALEQTLGRSPRPSEVARHLDVDVDDVVEALAADGCFTPTSLDTPLDDVTTTLGDLTDETDLVAADKEVTGAVEQLLGLTFEHFCTCVVLPQGDFAEFLHARAGDRQKILVKLLGLEVYDQIARAAASARGTPGTASGPT